MMDLFTPLSDLDLSINFSANTDDQYTRKQKISIIRKLSKVLYSQQSKYLLRQNIFRYSLHSLIFMNILSREWNLLRGFTYCKC